MDIAGFGSDALRCIEVDQVSSHRWSLRCATQIALDRSNGLQAVPRRRLGRHGGYRRHRRSARAEFVVPRGGICGFMSTERLARSEFSRRRSRRGWPGSSTPIRLRSISTNGDRCPTTPASCWCATATGIADTFAAPAAYLRRETRGLAAGSSWPCDLGPDLSRGFRALKTWFTLKTYGTEKLGGVITRSCALARYLEARILAEPRLRVDGAGATQHRLLSLSRR